MLGILSFVLLFVFAPLIANSIINAKLENTAYLTKDEEKKIRQQALSKARQQTKAKRNQIQITNKEWDAIQAGAISASKLSKIIDNCDSSTLKQLAMPRNSVSLSESKISRMKSMANRGYTTNEIASALGISTSTVVNYLKEEE